MQPLALVEGLLVCHSHVYDCTFFHRGCSLIMAQNYNTPLTVLHLVFIGLLLFQTFVAEFEMVSFKVWLVVIVVGIAIMWWAQTPEFDPGEFYLRISFL